MTDINDQEGTVAVVSGANAPPSELLEKLSSEPKQSYRFLSFLGDNHRHITMQIGKVTPETTEVLTERDGAKILVPTPKLGEWAEESAFKVWIRSYPGVAFSGRWVVSETPTEILEWCVTDDVVKNVSDALSGTTYAKVFNARAQWLERQRDNGGPQNTIIEFSFGPSTMDKLWELMERFADGQADERDREFYGWWKEQMAQAFAIIMMNDGYRLRHPGQ